MADDRTSGRNDSAAGDGGAGRRRRALRIVAWTAAAAVLLGGAGLGYVWSRLDGNLQGVDIDAALGTHRPENVDNGSTDILVLGSDSRTGANKKYGSAGQDGARSDTAMVVHVHEGRREASVVSIPRDTLVHRPSCERTEGGTAPAADRVMFNEAYQIGGPACAVKTVEEMSGIRMDHYLEVDFTGFKKLVDELGGVEITTREPIKDERSRLDLPPGTHVLDGEQSLGLVRTRHAVGNGSDLGRIHLQQAFVRALLDQVGEIGLFSDPGKLYKLADTATQAVTTDSELAGVKKLLDFSRSMREIGSGDLTMVTLPVEYDTVDRNRVVPREKQAREVWDALHEDKAIPGSATEDSAGDLAGDDPARLIG
ncbi:LCP family protein [Streptomyces zingiberis]|uniref:LytR family transcriptional regulator n=1 Tax=Streptomyces zingiberis TaxID=2053010 RepID=A0ABX1BYQ1_9ACTN|nr:LCP family protein [Streptomyces zingiberis]NJQ00817.1 LytR family transcriptional regulator [Streptomyces zingiberis]